MLGPSNVGWVATQQPRAAAPFYCIHDILPPVTYYVYYTGTIYVLKLIMSDRKENIVPKHIIGYFCGTGYDLESNPSFAPIQESVKDTVILGYGDQGEQDPSGQEQAKTFISALKQQIKPDEAEYQLNLVAH